MMDGISAMDTGNNGQMLDMNIESIAEVKVLTQGYQAEYGRSSGLQITAVTKSGTNRFRGSAYDSTPIRTGTRTVGERQERRPEGPSTKRDDRGYSIGGPVGKPGGNNKLFFFYSHEFRPSDLLDQQRQSRFGSVCRRRSSAPGDFSQTLDNNGALFNLIHDPLSTAACSATVKTGCFQDGGVIGRFRQTGSMARDSRS